MPNQPKKPFEELRNLLDTCPPFGSLWRHYKTGALYGVYGSAIAEATQEPMVIYMPLEAGVMFTRPLREWNELVEWEGKMVPRFQAASYNPP